MKVLYVASECAPFIKTGGLADVSVLGQTLDGRDLDLITVGTPAPGKRVLWVTARQHPGETMAEWWMEGFLQRLLDPARLGLLLLGRRRGHRRR